MKQRLYQFLVPRYIQDKLYQMNVRQYQLEESRRRELMARELPPIELSPMYIQHLRILANLNELLRMMPRKAVAAEIGTGHGALSERILAIDQPDKLLLVDNWAVFPKEDHFMETLLNRFKQEIQLGVVELCNGDPITELSKLPDWSLDWIFLSSDNSYEGTFHLLDTSRKKVKPNGIISGRNYAVGNWLSMQRYRVIEAVNKFCKDFGWEMIYLTHESHRLLSYALRRLPAGG